MSTLVTACPNCGARVDATPGPTAYVHTCPYCGAHIPIEPLVTQPRVIRVVAAQATTTASVNAATRTAANVGRTVGCTIAIATLLPLLIPVFIFLGPSLKGLYGSRFGSFPMAVGINDSIEIADRDGTLDDTLFTVAVNGKLTLRRCHLKGAMLAKAGANAEITIIDSTIEGTHGIVDPDGPNVVLVIQNSTVTSQEQIVEEGAVNTKVTLDKKSKVTAVDVAFPLDSNGEVTIDDASLEGKAGAIAVKNNGKVKITGGADVKSDGTALLLGNNGHVTVSASKIESKTIALRADYNLDASLRNATLTGPQASIEVGSNGRVSATQTTLAGPKLVPRGAVLEER